MLAQTWQDWLPSLPENAKNIEFGFTNMPHSWGVFVLIGIVLLGAAAVFLVYLREINTCPQIVKIILAAARLLVLLVLLVIFLDPALSYSTYPTREPSVVVLRDVSQSMNTKDSYLNEQDAARAAAVLHSSVSEIQAKRPTRVQIVNQLLDNAVARELQKHGKVHVADFAPVPPNSRTGAGKFEKRETLPADRKPKEGPPEEADASETPLIMPLEIDDQKARAADVGPTEPEGKAAAEQARPVNGRATDLGQAIRDGLALPPPLAALLLYTDGQNTSQANPLEAALEAKAKGVPLIIIGTGDPTRPRNLKVASLYVRPQVWQKEPFEIEAAIKAEGVEQRDVRVELIEQRAAEGESGLGPEVVVATQQLTLPAGSGVATKKFSHAVSEPGRYIYSVRVESLENESDPDDNRIASSPVKVLNRERMRVLLVAGAPTWEYRLVQKLLAREKQTVELSCWLQTLDEERAQEGTRVITKLPVTREELFYYDVVLLFDPNPQEFDEPWMDLLRAFANEHAGGILYMAGPKYSARFLTGQRTKKLRDVLPVLFGDLGVTEVQALLSTNKQAWPLKIELQHVDHPVMSFYSDPQENLARWENLPGIFWSFPALEAKSAASVLVEHSDPLLRGSKRARPLLVSGRNGAGNAVYIGFNGTWRWRQAGRNAEFFDKFWIQTVRYLVEGRALEGQRRGSVQTDKDRYIIGDRITITARLQDSAYLPLKAPQVEAMLESPGGAPQPIVLKPVASEEGLYQEILTARRTGLHALKISLPAAATSEESRVESRFTVELPSVETNQVWLNKPLLKDLATASGGYYFEIDELDKMFAKIPDATETIEVPGKPLSLWSDPLMKLFWVPIGFWALGLLVLTLSFEWAMRKAFKLL